MDYESLREASATCRGCDIYINATQTVFGEGSLHPQIMFVGEQPGDEEDLKGHPFVGPAGRLFNGRSQMPVSTANKPTFHEYIKHFKWKPRGKRRLHQRPGTSEINACRPWLDAEIEVVRPHIIVFMGATAAQSLLGKDFRVTKMRGIWLEVGLGRRCFSRPSSTLRIDTPGSLDAESRETAIS